MIQEINEFMLREIDRIVHVDKGSLIIALLCSMLIGYGLSHMLNSERYKNTTIYKILDKIF